MPGSTRGAGPPGSPRAFFYLSAPVVAAVLAEARRLSGDGCLIGADVFGSGLLTLPAMRRSLSTRSGRGLPPPFVSDDPAGLFKAAGWPSVQLAFPGQLGIAYGRPFDRSGPRPELRKAGRQSYLVVARTGGRAATPVVAMIAERGSD